MKNAQRPRTITQATYQMLRDAEWRVVLELRQCEQNAPSRCTEALQRWTAGYNTLEHAMTYICDIQD